MKDKVYEMPDDHKQAAANLVDFIELREKFAKDIKNTQPGKRREMLELLADLDRGIENAEKALAEEYELYQQKCRKEDELEEIMTDADVTVERVFIYIRHRVPHKFEEFEALVLQDCSPEEIEEFYDRVAIREATELDEILADKAEQ